MTTPSLLEEPRRVDEAEAAHEFSAVLTRVAAERRTVIVQRNGEDLAAVIPLEHLACIREVLAQREVEQLAGQINWSQARRSLRPPQSWFEGEEPKPF